MQDVCIYKEECTEKHLFIIPSAFLGHTLAHIQFTEGVWKPGYQFNEEKHYEHNRHATLLESQEKYYSWPYGELSFAPLCF